MVASMPMALRSYNICLFHPTQKDWMWRGAAHGAASLQPELHPNQNDYLIECVVVIPFLFYLPHDVPM